MCPTGAYQLSLFEEEATQISVQEAIQDITWSYSKRSTLERCTRQYYYNYFGANKLTAKQEPAKEALHFLKNSVKSRHLLSGGALHTVIKTYFLHARKGDIWNVDRLISFAQKIFRDSWAYSRAHPDGKVNLNEKYPPILLEEYYYEHPEAEDLCAAEESRLIDAVYSLATEDIYEQFRVAGTTPGALIEYTFKLTGFPCKVSGQIDLACQGDGKVTIVDWKLGVEDATGDNSLQLAAYGLWATNYFSCRPDMLYVCKAHLSSNEIVGFRVNAQALAAARARIIQDAERMAVLEKYGKEAVVEAFTRCGKPLVCNMCVFRRVCYA